MSQNEIRCGAWQPFPHVSEVYVSQYNAPPVKHLEYRRGINDFIGGFLLVMALWGPNFLHPPWCLG